MFDLFEVFIILTLWTPLFGERVYDVVAVTDETTCMRMEADFKEFVISQPELFLSIEVLCDANKQEI